MYFQVMFILSCVLERYLLNLRDLLGSVGTGRTVRAWTAQSGEGGRPAAGGLRSHTFDETGPACPFS